MERTRDVAAGWAQVKSALVQAMGPLVAALTALVVFIQIADFSYVLFHSIIEILRVVVCVGIFAIAWYSRRFLNYGYLLLLGVSSLFVGGLTVLHALAYKGMGVFAGWDANLPTQLWVALRFIETVSFLVALWMPTRRFNVGVLFAVYGAVTTAVLAGIFVWRVFPDCFIEGQGLTPFKKAAEYVMMALFVLALLGVIRNRQVIEERVLGLIALSTACGVVAELLFTVYATVYSNANFTGHVLLLASSFLLYKAIIETGFLRPQELLFWSLERERRSLRDEVEKKVVELDRQSGVHRQTQDMLALMRTQHRAILNAAGDGIMGVSSAGVVTFANGRAAEMIGTAPEALMGLRAGEVIPEAAAFGRRVPAGTVERQMRRRDGSVFPAELTITAIPETGGAEGAVVVFRDVTQRKEIEAQRRENADRLRKVLIDTVQAVGSTTEKRDPYTAGHQRQVAKLVRAIAECMGLPADRVEGVYLGALIHDIGKVGIPTEIMSRSGKLSPVEYELVKTHPRLGFDIIKDIEFPWPIREMILQHHESLDGSGYPDKLKGADISLEARILRVADTVEAMASHRPYRPALGLPAGLDEIKAHSGTLYDPAVVEACVTVIEKDKFTF